MKEHILIVEDDVAFCKTLTKLLEKEDYVVTGVSDGHRAIDEAKKSFFELIIADVRLPEGIDGIETVKRIKEIRPEAKSMVIIITGYADEDTPIKAIKLGVDDYIYKPFKMEEFLHSVERNIKIYRLEKEQQRHLEMLEKMNKELKLSQSELARSKKELEDYSTRLEEKVEEKTRQLKQTHAQLIQSAKMSAVGQLGAGVAHELNNPITGILGYAQFMLQKLSKLAAVPEELKSYRRSIEYIEKEAKRCRTIVENLLSFSRKSVAGQEPLDIKAAIESTLSLVKSQLKLQNIKLTTDYESQLPRISGNANQLQQVFTNIIVNAQQAMPKGGELNIRVSTGMEGAPLDSEHLTGPAGEAGKNLVISFKDRGCGIPKENLKRVFEPFFTTKEDWKSVGIGLSVTYHIIQEHKGTITVESEEGMGTTFTVTLPAKEG